MYVADFDERLETKEDVQHDHSLQSLTHQSHEHTSPIRTNHDTFVADDSLRNVGEITQSIRNHGIHTNLYTKLSRNDRRHLLGGYRTGVLG